MRTVRNVLFAFSLACSTSVAWAQYGLYGSPDTVPVPQPQTSQVYTTPTSYPATATPTAPSAPITAYYPRPNYAPQQYQPQSYQSYQAPAPQYRYPAQPQATAMYQPYQPGAQYRYPGPTTTRPPVRTALAAQPGPVQPMPAPPGPAAMAPVPAPAPQGSGMMNQVLSEQDSGGCYGSENGCGVYRGAVGQYERAACSPYADGCGYDGYGCDDYFTPWYASASALIMGRSSGRRLWTSSAPFPNEAIQFGNTDIPMSWKWGGEVRFGRRFCCACTPYALEATFWTTEALAGSQTTTNPNAPFTVSTPLQTGNINFILPAGTIGATAFFTEANSSTVSRRDEFYNLELNLIREQLAWACDSPWDIGWSAGVRWFRFQESLSVGVVNTDIGGGGLSGDAYFSDLVRNDLIGAQVGFDAAYNVGGNVRLFITPKFGVYNNHVDSTFQARGRLGAGSYADGTNAVVGYPNFPAHGSNNGVAFLTQIDLGTDWQFTRNWSARMGYRVVAITGVGLADDQFPQYLCDTPEMANPQHYASLILHGAFLGATYSF